MAREFKVIGKKVERVDAFERLTGEAKYASDIYLPGMLYVKILRSPYPHAKVVKIDVSRARHKRSLISPSRKGGAPPLSQSRFSPRKPVTRATRSSPWLQWMRRPQSRHST
jgi:hypothetical protein